MADEYVNPIASEFIHKLDPQFVDIYNRFQAPRLRADQVSIEEYRANSSKYTFSITPGPYPETGKVEVHTVKVEKPVGQIKVKVYHPDARATEDGALRTSEGLPCHVNYHGGGWVIGGLKSDERWCRQACQELGMIVVDVDYRLAPEYPFPTQIWDAWTALQWVFGNTKQLGIDRSRVSIGGLSAGGHLSAVVAILARDDPEIPPLKLQLLVVPCVDARWVPLEGPAPDDVPYESYRTCEFAPCLPLNRLRWFFRLWVGSDIAQRKEKTETWTASPILADSHAGLAPCSIHCAEFDCLRDEAIAYNALLNKSGTPSRIKVYKGVCHPWAHWDGALEKAKEYVRDTLADLKQAHAVETN